MTGSWLPRLPWDMDAATRIPLADVDDLAPGGRGKPGLEWLARHLRGGEDGVGVATHLDRRCVEEPGEAATASKCVDELEPVDAPPSPASRVASKTCSDIAHAVLEGLGYHLSPGRQTLEQPVVTELPALDQRRREPADEVPRVLEDWVGQVDAGEDTPGIAADRAQRVLCQTGHERLVDGRLDTAAGP